MEITSNDVMSVCKGKIRGAKFQIEINLTSAVKTIKIFL